MAPLPKRRHSSRRQSKRSRALNRSDVSLIKCQNCGEPRRAHRVCPNCGFYDGKMVVVKKEKKKQKEK